MIKIKNLTGGYHHHPVIKNLSLHIKKQDFFGIIGPNGSGKSTLVKMMSGVLPFDSGEIYIHDHSIQKYSAKALAKKIAVLSQHNTQHFAFTVKETVELGRYAFKEGFFRTETQNDQEIVERVMKSTGVESFSHLTLDQLSGGERQRVMLAQALAQEPEILILDEPTNHLDLAYQKELLDLLKHNIEREQLTVVAIFHDLNIASLYCDQIMLLNDGEIVLNDTPDTVLRPKQINQTYHTEVEKFAHPTIAKPQIMLKPDKVKPRKKKIQINKIFLKITKENIILKSPIPLRTMSSGVLNSGLGWYKHFINRHVDSKYNVRNYKQDMYQYLKRSSLKESETVAMMTAAQLENVGISEIETIDFSLLVVVTAGVNNATDASLGEKHEFKLTPGTINTWIFVSGKLTEEAFLQSIVTATEAKTIALRELNVLDQLTQTLATGTSTDSILVAATQEGAPLEFGGPISPLGSQIGKAVYQATKQALKNYYGKNNKNDE